MLILKKNKFISLPETNLKKSDLLEKEDLQESIIGGWHDFVKEIKIPELQFIGKEVAVHEKFNNRVDILAFDSIANTPVVIELKRSKNKFQLLQAISYAAMISSWDSRRFIQEARNQKSFNLDDIESIPSELDSEKNIKIILIAEKFDPEVIIAANWLHEYFKMDISAISIKIFKMKNELCFNFEQKYPLLELHNSYDSKDSQAKIKTSQKEKTWGEVIEKFKYEWEKELLKRCRSEKEGDPKYNRIAGFRSNDDEGWYITLYFRASHVAIEARGRDVPDNAEELLRQKFEEKVEPNYRKDGSYLIQITTQSQCKDLCTWLKIK